MKDFVTVKQAAKLIGCSRAVLYGMMTRKTLPEGVTRPIKVNSVILFDRRSVECLRAFLKEQSDENEWIDTRAAAQLLNRSVDLCYPSYEHSPLNGLACRKHGRTTLYRRSDVEALIKPSEVAVDDETVIPLQGVTDPLRDKEPMAEEASVAVEHSAAKEDALYELGKRLAVLEVRHKEMLATEVNMLIRCATQMERSADNEGRLVDAFDRLASTLRGLDETLKRLL